jgi:hypothetical protein
MYPGWLGVAGEKENTTGNSQRYDYLDMYLTSGGQGADLWIHGV